MKKLSLIAIACLAASISAIAQAPAAFNYQAIARNSSGGALSAQAVAVRFSVRDGSLTGPIVYAETQAATTNALGLFTLAIGRGTASAGSMAAINWGSGDKFLNVEISLDGGGTYTLQGTTQLLSVPYALYAQRTSLQAGNAIGISGNTISGTYTGSNGVAVSGSTVSGAYTGNNGVAVSGSNISGNYTGSNGIAVTGTTVSGAYTGTNGVSVSGSAISGNYQAGTGVTIVGNTISATSAASKWTTDANGIHYRDASTFGNVGIATPSEPNTALTLLQRNTGGTLSNSMIISGADTRNTLVRFRNQTSNREYQFSVAGSAHPNQPSSSFGITNVSIPVTSSQWVLNTDGTANNFVGIGSNGEQAGVPKSRLHVFNGDINLEMIGSGAILKSPDGQCWRVTISDAGALVTTAIGCP